jgi:hypothetical protein
MIAVSSSTRSFAALGRYLVVGRDKVDHGRVGWTSARNLPTDEPELAAKIMRATASLNVRVSQPVYHIALSFDPGDVVDRESMERVANRVLKELKLDQHQAIMVAHVDRTHPHLHILVNRVHPETGRAWDRWQDYATIQGVLREEERSLNLRAVHASVDVASDRSRVVDSADQMTNAVDSAARPPAASQSRTSKIEKDFDALDEVTAATDQRFAAERDVVAGESRCARVEAALAREVQARASFEAALKRAYVEPRAAAEAFLHCAEEKGERVAAAKMRESPESFGKLIAVPEAGQLWRRQPVEDIVARNAAREAAGYGAALVAARREIHGLAGGHAKENLGPALALPLAANQIKERVHAELDASRARLGALRVREQGRPSREQVELRLGHALRRLAPPEFERLRSILSGERFSIAGKLRRMARDAVLGRDNDE